MYHAAKEIQKIDEEKIPRSNEYIGMRVIIKVAYECRIETMSVNQVLTDFGHDVKGVDGVICREEHERAGPPSRMSDEEKQNLLTVIRYLTMGLSLQQIPYKIRDIQRILKKLGQLECNSDDKDKEKKEYVTSKMDRGYKQICALMSDEGFVKQGKTNIQNIKHAQQRATGVYEFACAAQKAIKQGRKFLLFDQSFLAKNQSDVVNNLVPAVNVITDEAQGSKPQYWEGEYVMMAVLEMRMSPKNVPIVEPIKNSVFFKRNIKAGERLQREKQQQHNKNLGEIRSAENKKTEKMEPAKKRQKTVQNEPYTIQTRGRRGLTTTNQPSQDTTAEESAQIRKQSLDFPGADISKDDLVLQNDTDDETGWQFPLPTQPPYGGFNEQNSGEDQQTNEGIWGKDGIHGLNSVVIIEYMLRVVVPIVKGKVLLLDHAPWHVQRCSTFDFSALEKNSQIQLLEILRLPQPNASTDGSEQRSETPASIYGNWARKNNDILLEHVIKKCGGQLLFTPKNRSEFQPIEFFWKIWKEPQKARVRSETNAIDQEELVTNVFNLYTLSDYPVRSIANEAVRLINEYSQPQYNMDIQAALDAERKKYPDELLTSLYVEHIDSVVYSLNHKHPLGKRLDKAIEDEKNSLNQYDAGDQSYITTPSRRSTRSTKKTILPITKNNQQEYRSKLRKRT